MNNKISLQELAAGMAARKDIGKKQAELLVRTVFDIVQEYVLKEGQVKVKGLGTFKLIEVESRSSVNISTGERIQIEGHSKITFTPDKTLADQVNKPFAGFTTVVLNPGTSIEEMEALDVEEDFMPEENTEISEEKGNTAILENKEDATPVKENVSEEQPEEEEIEQPVEEEAGKSAEEPQENITMEEQKKDVNHVTHQAVEQTAVEVQPVNTQTIQQLINNAVGAELKKRRGLVVSWGWAVTFFMLLLALVVGAFLLGHRMGSVIVKPAPKEDAVVVQKQETKSVQAEKIKPVAKKQIQATEKPAPEVQPVETQQQANPDASKSVEYEQMAGDYLIVGTKAEHVMKVGDMLTKLAVKHYGNKDLASYIVFYNKFKNPDVVPLGATVKIPELVKKEK